MVISQVNGENRHFSPYRLPRRALQRLRANSDKRLRKGWRRYWFIHSYMSEEYSGMSKRFASDYFTKPLAYDQARDDVRMPSEDWRDALAAGLAGCFGGRYGALRPRACGARGATDWLLAEDMWRSFRTDENPSHGMALRFSSLMPGNYWLHKHIPTYIFNNIGRNCLQFVRLKSIA